MCAFPTQALLVKSLPRCWVLQRESEKCCAIVEANGSAGVWAIAGYSSGQCQGIAQGKRIGAGSQERIGICLAHHDVTLAEVAVLLFALPPKFALSVCVPMLNAAVEKAELPAPETGAVAMVELPSRSINVPVGDTPGEVKAAVKLAIVPASTGFAGPMSVRVGCANWTTNCSAAEIDAV